MTRLMNLHPKLETRDAGQSGTFSCAFEVKAVNDDGSIEGYGSVFGVKDSYDDVIAPGAYKASLAAHKSAGTMPAMLWQHDAGEPCGVWDEMAEDAKGLKVKGRLAIDTECGKKAYSLLKMGALTGLSIGFVSKQWSYDRETEVRTLTEIDLWEVSLVTFPANGKARITSVKAIEEIHTIRDAEEYLKREAQFSDRKAKAVIAVVKRIANDERDAREAVERIEATAKRLLSNLS